MLAVREGPGDLMDRPEPQASQEFKDPKDRQDLKVPLVAEDELETKECADPQDLKELQDPTDPQDLKVFKDLKDQLEQSVLRDRLESRVILAVRDLLAESVTKPTGSTSQL